MERIVTALAVILIVLLCHRRYINCSRPLITLYLCHQNHIFVVFINNENRQEKKKNKGTISNMHVDMVCLQAISLSHYLCLIASQTDEPR